MLGLTQSIGMETDIFGLSNKISGILESWDLVVLKNMHLLDISYTCNPLLQDLLSGVTTLPF